MSDRVVGARLDVVRAALGENQINYLGFSYGTQLGAAYAERYGDGCGRWFSTEPSTLRLIRSPRASARWRVPDGLQRLRRRLRTVGRLPAGTDPAKFVDRFHQLVDRWWPSGRYVGSRVALAIRTR